MPHPAGLAADLLRTRCDEALLDFETTAELADLPGGLGQARAEEALRFGLAMRQPGYHVFVLGESGTGRHATALRLLREFATASPVPPDLCYVHNFGDALRPQLVSLPAGRGEAWRADMQTLIRELGPAIEAALESETHTSRIDALQEAHKAREENALHAIGEACAKEGVALIRTPDGFVFAPTENGETLSPEAFDALPEARRAEIEVAVGKWSDRLSDQLGAFPGWRKALQEATERAEREALEPTIAHLTAGLRTRYADLEQIQHYLDAICKDLLESGADALPDDEEDTRDADSRARFHRYEVNLLVNHAATQGAPIVYEDNPTFGNLVGRVEHVAHMGALVTNFKLIRPGALHRARGGYLVVDAERLLTQPFAWEALKRAIRGGQIMIEPPPEAQGWSATLTLSPEPVPCELKVVVIGDRDIFYLLSEQDPEFAELFKVAADFDDDLPRTAENIAHFARLMATLGRKSGLLPFDRGAIARMVEQSNRIAEDAARLSLRTRLLADIMREADFHARAASLEQVGAAEVDIAIAARMRRFGRYSERVLDSMLDGTILISTDGERAGQINALVVVEMSEAFFGHPMRITATVRMGDGDVVDIEREIELGGAIHSKGVLILSAFIAARYARHQPLSLSASLVFEQSYAPVEGDSASLAELCALLSALAEAPIRQSLAVTGSVNQFGEAQVVGGVNEKIEGFFDLCAARGLTGEQGVIIPAASVRHLMLRDDIVEAARRGSFHIYPVRDVNEAIEILTGVPAGMADNKGIMPRGSINERVASALAGMTAATHARSGGGRGARHRRRHEDY